MKSYVKYSDHAPRVSVRSQTFGDLLASVDRQRSIASEFAALLDKPFNGGNRSERIAAARERARNRTRFPTERKSPIPPAKRVARKIAEKMPPRRRKLLHGEAALNALLKLLELGMAPAEMPDITVSGVNPALTYLFEAEASPTIGPGYPIDFYENYPMAWSAQQRSHTTQPLTQGVYPFTAVLKLTRFPGNPSLPSNDGWAAGDEASMSLKPGRMTWRTVAVKGVEYFNPLNNTQPFNHARKVEYWKNTTAAALQTQVDTTVPMDRPAAAPMPEKQPAVQYEPRKLRLGYVPEFVVELRPGGRVDVRPSPQSRPPGGFGKHRYRLRNPVREHKLSVGASGAHVLKVMFSLLEMLDDAVDLWDVMLEAFPPGLSKLSRLDQIAFLSNSLNWSYFDGRAFAEGFTEWAAQELFYGRMVGSMENYFSDQIGASNRYGASLTSRSWHDDPVGALHEWIWSQI